MVLGLFSEHLRAVGFPIDGLLRGQDGSLSGSKTVFDNVGWGFWGNLFRTGVPTSKRLERVCGCSWLLLAQCGQQLRAW